MKLQISAVNGRKSPVFHRFYDSLRKNSGLFRESLNRYALEIMKNCLFRTLHQGGKLSASHIYGFPYAGGSIASYRPLLADIDPRITVSVAELPGHGSRIGEVPEIELRRIVCASADAIAEERPSRFVLFGHSMGAIVSFEVARELRRRAGIQPAALVLSGAPAPHRFGKQPEEYHHDLPQRDFIDYILRLEGTPEDIVEHPDLLSLVLPSLRADFKICETYRYVDEMPLGIPLVVLGGRNDPQVPLVARYAWADYTHTSCTHYEFAGGHFFLNQAWAEFGQIMNNLFERLSRANEDAPSAQQCTLTS